MAHNLFVRVCCNDTCHGRWFCCFGKRVDIPVCVPVHLCVFLCVYVFLHVCACVYMCGCLCVSVCSYACVSVSVCMYVSARVCACVFVHMLYINHPLARDMATEMSSFWSFLL